jgi:uncharacterized protein YndB with AHSA1/START domain
MRIAIEVTVRAPLARVWSVWTTPDDIMAWNATSDDWHCPHAEATFAVGGRFSCRMEARDGSVGFDFEGTFTAIEEGQRIDCLLDDERGVSVVFSEVDEVPWWRRSSMRRTCIRPKPSNRAGRLYWTASRNT